MNTSEQIFGIAKNTYYDMLIGHMNQIPTLTVC